MELWVDAGRATAGVDWASQTHVGCVVGADGAVIDRFDIAHDDRALTGMTRRLRTAGVQDVAIERGDGPVVKVLLQAGFSVFVVPSRQIKSLRSRYGSAGNKDDRFDAYVLADTLRTDGHRWRPLREDHEDTRALRALCRSRKDLVETRVQVMNQLRSNLELALPGAIGLFTRLDSKITLAFLRRFPTAEKVAWLSVKRLESWLGSVGYSGGISAAVLFQRMTDAAPGLAGAEGVARGRITLALVAVIESLNAQVQDIEEEMSVLLDAHPDAPVFTSLPRSGMVRAASLLAEIGDCRERFPSDDALAALAGASPSTRQSGNANSPCSAGRATRSSAPPSWTSPTAVAPPIRGPPTCTDGPSPGAVGIHTPSESWPAPGSESSGAAGKTAFRSTRAGTRPLNSPLLDIGHFYVLSTPGDGQCPEEFAGDVALDAAADFRVALAFGAAPFDVVVGAGAVPPAGLHDVVQGPVELPVAAAVEPVPHGPAAAGLQRAGAGQGRECGVVTAPADMGEGNDGLRGADWADAEAVQQSGREGLHELGELLLVRGQRGRRFPDRQRQSSGLGPADLLLPTVQAAAPPRDRLQMRVGHRAPAQLPVGVVTGEQQRPQPVDLLRPGDRHFPPGAEQDPQRLPITVAARQHLSVRRHPQHVKRG